MVHKNSYGHIEINVQNVHPPLPPPLFRPPYEWYPWIVPMFFNINLIVFIVSMYINNCPAHSHKCIGTQILQRFAFENVHENPLLGPSTDTLEKMGALDAEKVIQEGQQWRILTCMWLHAGVFHIFANMLSLLSVGIRLEQEFGFVRIGLIYILSGIGGSMLSALFVRKTISVGASGALFGVLGAMLSELLTNWTIYVNKMATLTMLILMILINLMIGILPHVDNFAHIGGFVTGFFLGFILLIRPRIKWINQPISPFGYYGQQRRPRYKLYQYIYLILSIIALIVMFTVGLVYLFRKVDGNDYCSWCHYLSCIPTPLWSCNAQCNSTWLGDQLDLICLSNGKSKSYMLPGDNDMLLIRELCANLCT